MNVNNICKVHNTDFSNTYMNPHNKYNLQNKHHTMKLTK